jgi:hypothetical protein
MTPDEPLAARPGGMAMRQFGMEARVEARMLKEGEPVISGQRSALVRDLRAYRDANLIDGKPISLAKLAGYIGVSQSVLTEWTKSTYKGDDERISRLVDQFLAREDQRGQRASIRGFASIRAAVEVMVPAVNQAVLRRSMAVITGEPGSGKSLFAKWYVERNDGAVLITCDDADRDAKFVIDALHLALRLGTYSPHARQKKREIEAFLQAHKNTVIIVDESQKLTADALELLRSLHDKSDPDGVRNVPVILFGDDKFYAVVCRSRGGERTPISPQITSRMFPVVSLERQGLQHDDDGQTIPDSVFTRDDIDLIVKNGRLRLVRSDAVAWVVRLANLHGHGRLRLAARVLEIAIDIKQGPQVCVDDLVVALDLFLGPSEAKLCVDEMKRRVEPAAMAKVG